MSRIDTPEPTGNKPGLFWITPDRFDTKQDKSSWLEMARELAGRGWQAHIVTSKSNREAPDYDGLVSYVPAVNKPLLFFITAMLGCWRFVATRSRNGDVVIVNQDGLWLLPLLRLLGRRHIHLDLRTLPVNIAGLKRRIGRWLLWKLPLHAFGKRADSHSFITERLRQEVEREFGWSLDTYCIWQSGVNLQLFSPDPDGVCGARELTLFYHGSISNKRGLPELIRSLALDEFPCDVRLVLVGDGPHAAELEALAQRLGLADVVRFEGLLPYERVVERINAADVCVCPLPDRLEWNVSSPLKVLEYMACEKPMVLTPIPAHLDVAGSADFVVWTSGSSPEDFHQAIREVCANRESLRENAQRARAHLVGSFEWRDHAHRLSRHLEEATADAGQSVVDAPTKGESRG